MDNDITGLEFTVTSSSNGEGDGGIKLVEDEWYPAVLTQFKPYESVWNGQKTKGIRWMFSLQGPEFTWKSKDGKTGQFSVSLSTSYICSPKSKLYKVYSKLIGKEPTEGEKINLKSLINTNCFVMVKISKGANKDGEEQTWYNVDKVKAGTGKINPTTEVKEKVSEPNFVPPAVLEPQTVVKQEQKPGEKAPDIFEDIF